MLLIPLGPALSAQDTQPTPAEPIHTLHVYMDLIQVPVLVLDNELERMKPMDKSHFNISLDSGPVFHPRSVRPEGDDPISLAILLDGGSEPDLMPKIGAAIASLAPGSLRSQDRITLYGLDCSLVRTSLWLSADPTVLQDGVDQVLHNWTERHKTRHPPPCAKKVQLWDAIGFVTRRLGEVPGRRVMLVVSNGEDRGSMAKWADVRAFAQENGVAVFGYSSPNGRTFPSHIGTVSTSIRPGRSGSALPAFDSGKSSEDPFNAICQLSGGMVMQANEREMPKDLARFITLVRERYIVEFARARNDSPGQHGILVTIDKSPTAYVRPAGVVITMRDAALDADPSTIPRDATNAPEIGKRKPIH